MQRLNHSITPARKRAMRVRGNIIGSTSRPRVTIHRSNKYVWIQAIDDASGKVLAVASDKSIRTAQTKATKTESAVQAGVALAQALHAKKITSAVFDRGSFRYHGRVAAVANALRTEGIQV